MHLGYSSKENRVHFFFSREEAGRAEKLFELAVAREVTNGNPAPMIENILRRVSETSDDLCFEFTNENIKFAISLLNITVEILKKEESEDAFVLEEVLELIKMNEGHVSVH